MRVSLILPNLHVTTPMTDTPEERPRFQNIREIIQGELGKRFEEPGPQQERQWHGSLSDQLPILHLEDVSAIPFIDGVAGIEEYQHRARVRAKEGDLFASISAPAPGYEEYCRDHLGLGRVECVQAEKRGTASEVALACSGGDALERISKKARAADGMIVHPYMGIEAVWGLASVLEGEASVPVHVLAPVPSALWIANDKQRLDEVARLIGLEHILVDTRWSDSAESIASSLRELASLHTTVGLKRTRCASAMGNEVHTSASILEGDEAATLSLVQNFLERTEWPGDEQVLVVQWAETHLSPSTQLWIPPLGEGSPRLDGVFEQLLEGPEKVFLGSRPSTLPKPVERALGEASLDLCVAFQEMGYVGRCSFDFLVLGDVNGDFEVKLTECNGRWGGTSTPMYLVDRLIPAKRPAYIAQDVMDASLVGVPFTQILERTRAAGELFDPNSGQGRFIYYNVGPLTEKGKLDVISIGSDPEDARHGMLERLPEVLGF